ncbi:MAG: acyl-CoA desaturase, partial [Xanthomonadales bacterium]|nr:acyl-CoA desaturase [Xanthomonadales bacterium]
MSEQSNPGSRNGFWTALVRWFDTSVGEQELGPEADRIDWARVVPFLLVHLCCLFVFVVGWSWTAVIVAALSYALRMFAVTGFYHRYFSHKTFKTSRLVQFLFALLATSSV